MTELIITITLAVWLIIMGAVIVNTGETAAVYRLGKYHRTLKPGLGFIIPFLERAEVFSTQTHQDELPGEPEQIDRVNDNPEPGKKPPFRIPQKGMEEAIFYVPKNPTDPNFDPTKIESYDIKRFGELDDKVKEAMQGDPLHAPLTSEVPFIVEWNLEPDDSSIKSFIENVEPMEGRTREEEVTKRMEDTVARALQEFLGPITAGHAMERFPLLSSLIRLRLERLVGETPLAGGTTKVPKPWGIHISDAYIKNLHPGHTVNKARNEASAAVAKKQETIRLAEGQAEAAKKKADADAYTEKVQGEGERDRVNAMAEAMKDPNAQFIAQLEVAREVLPTSNVIVMPSDLGVVGGVLTLAESLKKKTAQ